MSDWTGLGPLELGLLSVLDELGAVPGMRYVKGRRVVEAASARLDVAPVYLVEILRDLYRPWQVAMPLVAFHGNSEADMSYNECRLTPVGAMALRAEAGRSAALPIRLINGTVHQGGRQPPFPADRVIAALVALVDQPAMSDQEVLDLVGPPVFPHGCDVLGDIQAVHAGHEVTLRLYPSMRVTQVGESIVIQLVNFPPRIWAAGVAQWLEQHLGSDEEERSHLDFERLPIREVQDISYGTVDHSNERIHLVLDDRADPNRVIGLLRHDPESDPLDYWSQSPVRSDMAVQLGQSLPDLLRNWVSQHRDERLTDTLTQLRNAAEQPDAGETSGVMSRSLRLTNASIDSAGHVPVMEGRTKTFPPALANEPLPETIPPDEEVLIEIRRGSRLHGTAGPSRFEVNLHQLFGNGHVTGTLDGRPFTTVLRETPSPDDTSLRLNLNGTLDDQPIDLHAQLYPPPGRLFGHADITGAIADDLVNLHVEGANGGLGSSDTVAVEGTVGDPTVSLFGATDLRRGVIRGTINGHEAHLRATTDHHEGALILHGRYNGSLPLLVLAAVVLQTFA